MLKGTYNDELMNKLNSLVTTSNCPVCGGVCDYHTGICKYCDSFNESLKYCYDEVISIISSLDINNISRYLIVQLYDFIKHTDIKCDFLDENSIVEKTKEIIKELGVTYQYSSEDEEVLDFIFTSDSFLDIDRVLRDLIIRRVMLKQNTLSMSLIGKVLRHLVISSTREYDENSEFYIKKIENGDVGETFRYDVFLSEEKFNNFYKEGNVNIFFTLAHEIRHVYQEYCRNNNIITSYIELLALKEAILRGYNSDIYCDEKNYVKNLYEIDANIYSYSAAVSYLESLGCSVFLDVDSMIDREMLKVSDHYREIDGEIVDFNDLFAEYIKDKPSLLNCFPQLKYEFKEEDGNVIYRSEDELKDEFLCSFEGLEELYFNLISNAKKRENIKNDEIMK